MLSYDIHILRVKQYEFINYTYLIVDNETKKLGIVDPSWNYEIIIKTVEKLNKNIDFVLLTHSHIDHVYIIDRIIENHKNVNIYMSDVECRYYNFSKSNLKKIYDGDVLKIGKTDVTCILTPGHTKGSMCFLLQESIFTGDTIFAEGCGVCTSSGGNAYDMYHSIQRIKEMVRPYVKIYSGHSFGKQPGSTLQEVLKNNIYFQIDDKQKFVEFRNRNSQENHFAFK